MRGVAWWTPIHERMLPVFDSGNNDSGGGGGGGNDGGKVSTGSRSGNVGGYSSKGGSSGGGGGNYSGFTNNNTPSGNTNNKQSNYGPGSDHWAQNTSNSAAEQARRNAEAQRRAEEEQQRRVEEAIASIGIQPDGTIRSANGIPLPPDRASAAAQAALRQRELTEMQSSPYYDPNNIFNQVSTGDLLGMALDNNAPASLAVSAAQAASRRVGGNQRLSEIYGQNIGNQITGLVDFGNREQGWADNFNWVNPLAMGEQRPEYQPGVRGTPNANWYWDPVQQAIGLGAGMLSPIPGSGMLAGAGYGALSNGATQIGLGDSVIGQPDPVADPDALSLSQQVALGKALGLDTSALEQQIQQQNANTQAGGDNDNDSMLERLNQLAGTYQASPQQATYGSVVGGQTSLLRDNLLNATRQAALNNVEREFRRRGLDPENWRSELIDPRFNEILSTIPDSVNSFDSYFSPGLGADIIDQEQQSRRSTFENQLNNVFGTGFDINAIPDTADDPYINNILEERFMKNQQLLDNAMARGNLSAYGYRNAYDNLFNQRSAAESRLDELGSSVLGTYRQDARQRADTARQAASEYTLGQDFNIDDKISGVNSFVTDRLGNLEGDLRGSLGSSTLFDVGNSLNYGGQSQGQVSGFNPAAANRASDRDRSARRGIGNTGAF